MSVNNFVLFQFSGLELRSLRVKDRHTDFHLTNEKDLDFKTKTFNLFSEGQSNESVLTTLRVYLFIIHSRYIYNYNNHHQSRIFLVLTRVE